jgi:hypothetical protein
VFVNGGQGLKLEMFRDLLETRSVALLVDVALQIREYFALTLGQRHQNLLAEAEYTE